MRAERGTHTFSGRLQSTWRNFAVDAGYSPFRLPRSGRHHFQRRWLNFPTLHTKPRSSVVDAQSTAAMSALETVQALIPHRPPFLFVDEIVSESAENLVARRTWRADEDFYRGHYPGAPITPGVLLCEAVFQTGALYMARQAQAAGAAPGSGIPLLSKIADVRFRTPIYPGDTILIEVKKKEAMAGFTMMGGSIKKTDGTRVLTVDFTVAWKTPEGGAAAQAQQQQAQ